MFERDYTTYTQEALPPYNFTKDDHVPSNWSSIDHACWGLAKDTSKDFGIAVTAGTVGKMLLPKWPPLAHGPWKQEYPRRAGVDGPWGLGRIKSEVV